MTTLGLVGAGAMGTALAGCLSAGGHRVLSTLAGRSAATRRRATHLEDAGDLDALVDAVEILMVVVPPGAARDAGDEVARACTRTGARPLVVELDAVAPSTVAAIAADLPTDLVDGGISGPPPRPDTDAPTRVFLSGPRAGEVAALRAPGVRWIVLAAPVGAASAAKMSTASVRKGFQALLAHALVTAEHHGVLEAVLDDVRLDFPAAGVASAASAASKAWRFVDEMEQIARTQADAGLTPALFDAMAEVYRALATAPAGAWRPEDVPASVDVEDLRPR